MKFVPEAKVARVVAATSPDRTVLLALIAVGVLAVAGATLCIVAVLRTRRSRKIAEQELCDDLTGVGNRRRLERDLAIEASNDETAVAVIKVDIDHFDRIAEDHGNEAGDQVLCDVADVMRRQVRGGDVVYRYADEQFCVLLAQTNTTEAGQVAERIRSAVSRTALAIDGPLTVSIGVALGKGAHVAQTMERADEALFKSKDGGRDRVTLATQPLLGPLAVSLPAEPVRGATLG
ncbi:MAG: GGDEF domain-containing protein [Ilumatobacteraceae bacterium]